MTRPRSWPGCAVARARTLDVVRGSASAVLGHAAGEVVRDEGIVADDPGVVPGTDHVDVAGADLGLGSVVHAYSHPARQAVAVVVDLAAGRAGHRSDRF